MDGGLKTRRKDGIRTAGMLLRDGISKGHEPTVQVLEISANAKRQPSDLLPYLSEFTKFFAPLPRNASDMRLKAASVPLSDVESITVAHIKVNQPYHCTNFIRSIKNRKGSVNIRPRLN